MTRSSPQTGPKADRAHNRAGRFIAIYMRLSDASRYTAAQESDLQRWSDEERQADLRRWADGRGREVRWYKDSWTGSDPSRPEWDRLVEDITKGLVETVVCWRLDRLGKTCSELVKLFEYLSARSVNFISLKDHLDLSTVSGRRMAGVLGSITLYETEVRAQGILAGQEAARARGIRWGGSEKGRRVKVSLELEAKVKRLKVEGRKISHIARETGLSRPTIYKVLGEGSPSTCEERESGNRDNGGREIDERAATGDISPDGTDEPSDDAEHFM
jgi:DNA invertase Pin-like site-specific DNA recombinase